MKAIIRLTTTLALFVAGWILSPQTVAISTIVSFWTCGFVTWLMLELLLQNCTLSHSWMDESRASHKESIQRCAKGRQRLAA